MDRVTLLRGRLADPRRADEFVVSASGAKEYGLHIGSTLPLGFYTDQQASSPTFAGYPTDKPHLSIDMKLVGIIEASQQVVQDDDAALGDQLAVITPALTRRLATCCAYYTYVALQIDDAARHEAAVSAAVDKIVPGTALGSSGGGQTDTADGGGSRAGHPSRSRRLRRVRARRRPRRIADLRPGDRPPGPAQRRGRRGATGPGRRARS